MQIIEDKLTHKFIRSFGRVKSRKLGSRQNFILENILPKYELAAANSASLNKNSSIFLEIGFGFGDFTFNLAKDNPQSNIIAGETHLNGIINLLGKLEENPLNNIKIVKTDIRPFLLEVADNIFDKIFILFPDPWPKAKHYKRRLINSEFLDILIKKIKNNGQLIIATDHDSYKCWIMSAMTKRDDFIWQATNPKDWEIFPSNWTYTKYQNKAKEEGRTSIYLEFTAKK